MFSISGYESDLQEFNKKVFVATYNHLFQRIQRSPKAKKTPTWHGSKVTAAVNRRMLDSYTFSVEAFAKAYQAACLCSHKTPWPGHQGAHQPEICTKNKQMKPTELEGMLREEKSPSLRLASAARGELHITYRVEQVELDKTASKNWFSWAVWRKELLIENWVFASDVFLDSETKVAKILWWWSLQLYFWIWKLQQSLTSDEIECTASRCQDEITLLNNVWKLGI